MTLRTLWLPAFFTFASLSPAFAAPPTTRPAQLRVGVYDSRAVAVAYVRSGAIEPWLKDLQKQRDDAKAKGDEKRVKEIEAQGKNTQMLRHLQGFSNAPIDDIMLTIKDKLPTIAQQAGVDLIVSRTDYLNPNLQTIDVTDGIVALFKPDEKTIRIITELRKHDPAPMLQILGMED